MTDAQKKSHAVTVGLQIARLMMTVDTDYRGNMLLAAGNELKTNAQGYTGRVLQAAARDYGVDE